MIKRQFKEKRKNELGNKDLKSKSLWESVSVREKDF